MESQINTDILATAKRVFVSDAGKSNYIILVVINNSLPGWILTLPISTNVIGL